VKKFCRAKNPGALPIKKSKPRTKRLIERHAFVVSHGRVLLEQSSARWRGMWILPRFETGASDQPLYRSTFPFTHHRIAFVVYRRATPNRISPAQQWFESIDDIAMHRLIGAQRKPSLAQNKQHDHASSGRQNGDRDSNRA
jgi:hypothetical protein